MSPTPKVIREQIADDAADRADFRDNLDAVYLHGIERLAQIQKQSLDFAVQQNAEMVDVLKDQWGEFVQPTVF